MLTIKQLEECAPLAPRIGECLGLDMISAHSILIHNNNNFWEACREVEGVRWVAQADTTLIILTFCPRHLNNLVNPIFLTDQEIFTLKVLRGL